MALQSTIQYRGLTLRPRADGYTWATREGPVPAEVLQLTASRWAARIWVDDDRHTYVTAEAGTPQGALNAALEKALHESWTLLGVAQSISGLLRALRG